MKRFFVVLMLLVMWAAPVMADFQAGKAAFDRGDYATALREFRLLAEQGDAEAQFYLGDMYANGQGVLSKGVRQNYAEAARWFHKAAKQRLVEAQLKLGFMYKIGMGIRQDYAEAVKWYRKAAEQGDADAQESLGVAYSNGRGVTQNDAKAKQWLLKSADQGNTNAYLVLGSIASRPNKNAKDPYDYDYAKAIPWYLKAVEKGDARAKEQLILTYSVLGGNYILGRYVTKDLTKGVYWHRKTAEMGDAGSQFYLGFAYEYGRGVAQDNTEAVKWYRKAAGQGDADAQYSLGVMYHNGQGVPTDYVQAYSWFSLAAAQGDADAIKLRDLVAKSMTPVQIAEGQRMARNWRPGKQAAPSTPSSPSAPQLAATPSAAAPQGLAGLQRQLKRIEGLVAAKPKPMAVTAAPKPASTPKFPTKPVAVRFAKVKPRPDDIAVIIGNADYEKGKDIPDVIPAYADANGIRRYVTQALGVRKKNIIFLKDATQAEMTSTFGTKDNPKGQLFNYVTPGKSRVFVYYSGHGAPSGKDGDSYLVPSNAQASTIDLNGYPLKTLYRNLSAIPAKSITVVLEACFSGASQAGSVINKASPIYLKAKDTGVPANITLIAAGAANQIASWEQDSSSGLFTEYFLKGMSGEADAKPYGNGDGKVGYAELGRYLKGTLTYYARRYYGRDQTAQIVVGK